MRHNGVAFDYLCVFLNYVNNIYETNHMKVNTVTQGLITKTIPFPGMKVALLKREQKWYQLCRKK
jgi:nitrate reductase assembly molybdenum cofactor insertion protein NarJ